MEVGFLNRAVAWLFGEPDAALWISASILAGCAGIIIYHLIKHHNPLSAALKSRVAAVADVRAAETTDEAQQIFSDRFEEIDAAMTKGGKEAHEIRQAWSQFRETILDDTETPKRATMRADEYFLHLGDDTRVLAWWANLFVAFGLTFTFLGIVAALTMTVITLNSGAGSTNMTPALISLLTITSVKFWTSIAGVVASIVLRYFDRLWHARTQRGFERIVDALDKGTLFSPPQRIAAAQLRETQEQTAALKTFSHELAVAIGEKLESQIQPMVNVLGGIQSSIDDFKSGSFNQIGKELSEAISRNAGTEMQQLGAALTDMTTKLSSMHEQIEGSGKAAHEQIATAARDFSSASERMTEMFATLNQRIEATGTKLTDSANAASEDALGRFSEMTSGMQAAFDQMRGEVADIGTRLTAGADAAATRNADVLSRAADALEAATSRASESMGKAIDDAVAKAADESAKAISSAFATFGERFESVSAGLVDTLRSTAGRMEALASSIERSAQASDAHASSVTKASDKAESVSTSLTRAANDLENAASPIRSATEAINAAVSRVQSSLERHAETTGAAQTQMSDIAEKLGETTEAATRAWSDYRSRFEDVDRALAASLDQIKNASGEHAQSLTEQVGRVDTALADAVEKLGAGLDPLRELAGQIEDLLGKLQARA